VISHAIIKVDTSSTNRSARGKVIFPDGFIVKIMLKLESPCLVLDVRATKTDAIAQFCFFTGLNIILMCRDQFRFFILAHWFSPPFILLITRAQGYVLFSLLNLRSSQSNSQARKGRLEETLTTRTLKRSIIEVHSECLKARIVPFQCNDRTISHILLIYGKMSDHFKLAGKETISGSRLEVRTMVRRCVPT
jgi:hypothetical protein